jgi:uncharacterized protein YjiS (DUF1127 family)
MIEGLRQLLNRPTDRPSDNKRRGDVLDRFIRWRQRRKAAEWLRSMPDYLLKDIGLSRRSRNLPGRSAAGADDTR